MVAMMLLAPSARCQEHKVVVIEADPRVLTAIDVALSAWSLSVGPAPGPLPEQNLDAASGRARAIAAEHGAGAVVWVAKARTPDETGSLWVYDAQTGQLVVRPLTVAAPLNDAGAAAIALSVKTILRSSTLAEAETSTLAPVSPAPRMALPLPVAQHPIPAAPAARATPSVWRLDAIVGARFPTGAKNTAEPRAALGISAWPKAFGSHFGLGALVQAGPGVPVEQQGAPVQYQGLFSQGSFEACAHVRADAGPRVAFEAQAGPALVVSSLDLEFFGPTPASSKHKIRFDPTVNVGAIIDFALGPRIGFGVLFETTTFLYRQKYTIDTAVLLDEPPVNFLWGARLSVGVD